MKRRILLIIISIILPMISVAVSAKEEKFPCPLVELKMEKLPDMNVPRSGHFACYVNGELTVMNGHTSGFVPTPTAEYYADGKWNLLKTVYTHDNGLFLVQKSGKVLLGGGHEKNLGIGQSFEVEMYDPNTHTFNGFGCLDKKRALASALEIDSGKVVIAGNWYHDDAIEVFDGNKRFQFVKHGSLERACPYIFRSSENNVLIFSGLDTRGKQLDSISVDQLQGEAFVPSLFKKWKPILRITHFCNENSFIGDETKGYFAYLFPVINAQGQLAIAQTEGKEFSLLPTVCPVPMQTEWGEISYETQVFVDRKIKRGYIIGVGINQENGIEDGYRLYLLSIDYGHLKDGKASLTLYYSKPLKRDPSGVATISPEGNIVLTGGVSDGSNFTPSATVYLLRVNDDSIESISVAWLVKTLILSVFIIALLIYLRHRSMKHNKEKNIHNDEINILNRDKEVIVADEIEESELNSNDDSLDESGNLPESEGYETLMLQITKLMNEEKLYLNSELKLSDIAKKLGVNRNMVSSCINSQKGCSFTQFIAYYRVEYAKQQLCKLSEKKISHIWTESGFANETSFFRTFKILTGMTPKEWKEKCKES